MPIAYYSGPEGACKSVMMGRDCLYHHSCGGKVFSFPGFEVMNNRGKVISELLMPEEWILLLNEDESNYVVAIDEITNFINHHKWNSSFVDLITYGAAAQRRKRSMVILATGPIFEWLPPDLRYMFHEIIRMEDRHWKLKYIPVGEQAAFTREDRRGVLSGRIGRRTRPKLFYAKKYWKNINTYSIVDPRYQLSRYQFDRREVFVDADGNIVSQETDVPPDAIDIEKATSKVKELFQGVTGPIREADVWRYLGIKSSDDKSDMRLHLIRECGFILKDRNTGAVFIPPDNVCV